MANVLWADFLSATQTTAWYETLAGAVTVDTGVTLDGNTTLKLDTSSPAATVQATTTKAGAIAAAGRGISRYFRFSALPASGQFLGILSVSNSTTVCLGVSVDSNGKLILRNNTVTMGAVGSTTLSVNTWYRVSLSYTVTTTTNWSAKVYLGQAGDSPAYSGTLELNRTNADGTLSAATCDRLQAFIPPLAGANITLNITHTAVDDRADLTDPGNWKTTGKKPTTTTTNNFDTTLGTGAVNERPVSTTNGKSHANTTDVDQDYEIEAASAGDADLTGATIVGNVAWIWAALNSLTSTPLSKIIHNGARDGGTWDPASANVAQLFTVVSTSATYPKDANGKNIGSSSSVIAADTLLYDCGVGIVYIPSTGPATFTASTTFALALGLSATPLAQAITSTTFALVLSLAPTNQATRLASSSFTLALALAPTAVQAAPAATTFTLALALAPTAIVAQPTSLTFALSLGLSPTAQSTQLASTTLALVLNFTAQAGLAVASTSFTLALSLLPTAIRAVPATTSFTLVLAPIPTPLQIAPVSTSFTLALGLAPQAVWTPAAQTSFALLLGLLPSGIGTIQATAVFSLMLTLTPEALIALLTMLTTSTGRFGSRMGPNTQPERDEPESLPGFGGGVIHFR